MWLRKFEYLDEKWLKCNLNGALKDPYFTRSAIFNTLIEENELSATKFHSVINATGRNSYLRSDGKYYCGGKLLNCSCCEGICGPTSSCVCDSCKLVPTSLELADEIQNHHEKINDNTASSELYFESWMWGPIPGKLANVWTVPCEVLFSIQDELFHFAKVSNFSGNSFAWNSDLSLLSIHWIILFIWKIDELVNPKQI